MPPVDVGTIQVPPQPEQWECHLYLKNRRGARRLPALQLGSSEHAGLLTLGHDQTSPAVYSAAAGAEEGHNVLNCRALPVTQSA